MHIYTNGCNKIQQQTATKTLTQRALGETRLGKMDQQEVNFSSIPRRVASCRITRKTGGKRKKQQSRHRALFIPKEGKETLEVNLGKNMVSRPKRMGSGVGYANGRYQHPYASVVLYGIHCCSSCLKGVGLSNVLFTKKKGLNENDSRGCRIHCIRISSEYENQSLRSSADLKVKGNCAR